MYYIYIALLISNAYATSEVCLTRNCTELTGNIIDSRTRECIGVYDINIYIMECDCSKSCTVISVDIMLNGGYRVDNGYIWIGKNVTTIPRDSRGYADPEQYPYTCENEEHDVCSSLIPASCLCKRSNSTCLCGKKLSYSIAVEYTNYHGRTGFAWADGYSIPRERYVKEWYSNGTYSNMHIGCGDEVFLTGLFNSHYGKQNNLPIIRIGNIASMPEEPIQTKNMGAIDAYLIEARSIGGLSGSPVFVQVGGVRGYTMYAGSKFYWLGLMHGHFDLSELELDEVSSDTLMEVKVNMGIAIVVPVSKILEVLNQDELVKGRKQQDETDRLKRAATPDTT